MSRVSEIREEALKQEAHWHGRRVAASRIALFEAKAMGMTATETAKYMGISYKAVCSLINYYGVKLRRSERNGGIVYRERMYGDSPNIEVKDTAQKTAIANRGKASAAQIAAACGTTRNAVIGYWFRARQMGIIQ
jgi:hypothetical protein